MSSRKASVRQTTMQAEALLAGKELERRVRELDRIYELANAVSRAASLDEIYSSALACLTEVLGADRAAVLLFDASGVMRFQASRGISDDYRSKAEGHTPWKTETRNPEPVLIEDAALEPALAPLAPVILGEGIRGLGFFPLVDEGRLLGKLMVYYDSPHSFSHEERQLSETVARHVAFGIARKLSQDALRDNAHDRQEAESALRESEQELADFFENASVGMLWVGPDGIIQRVNRAELEMLGYEREEYVGRNIADFHVDAPVIEEILLRMSRGEKISGYEARLRCKNGSIRHVRIDSSAYFKAGKFIHTRCFTRDVTELKATEARERLHFAVTRVLAEAATLRDAAPRLLQAICDSLGWDVGSVWILDQSANRLRCIDVWHAPSVEFSSFEKITRDMAFSVGVGMPGRVWSSGRSAWILNVTEDPNFPRAPYALKEGIRAACGFPIESRGELIGVIEFFSREKRAPDPELMTALEDLGSRIGQFIQRKQAEEAFREREENYRALFEVNPLPMWLRDPTTLEFVAVNDAAVRQYGYSREEFLHMTVRDILAPEEAAAVADFRWEDSRGIEPWNAGLRRHRRKDGSFLWVEVSVRDLVVGERRLRLILASDVTERKRVEEEDRFLAEASAILGSSLDSETTLANLARRAVPELGDWCVIDVVDRQGTPIRVGAAGVGRENDENLRRYPPNPSSPFGVYHVLRTGESELVPEVSEEMLDQVAWDAEQAEILKAFVRSYMAVPLRAGNRVLGTMLLVRTTGSPRYGERDLALAEELGRRAGLAVENARLYAETRDASAQKSRFLSAVSHDLRTPANAITLLSSLIRKETERLGVGEASRLIERCRRLETASASFADLLSDLLEIGSFDSGQKRLREEDFALSDVIDETLATCAAAAREKGLRLRVRWDVASPGIRGDRTEFGRVLLNLVSNAVKFTQRGFVKVEVSRASEGSLQIGVRDTGPGIPSEHLSSVFSEFFQVQNDERDRSKGSGLGLAISRRIMQAMGGSLRVESQVGVGSLFTASLPPARVLADAPGQSERGGEAARSCDLLTNGSSVLIIDDDSTSREALTELLKEEGYEVLSAAGGEEGLESARKHRPDVLLLDMMMPGIDGVEVIRQIRSEPDLHQLRIIALTGDVTRARLQNVFDAGADRFVAKPFRIPELLDSVRTLLRPSG
jgi:PAS domain S-box-containing protein